MSYRTRKLIVFAGFLLLVLGYLAYLIATDPDFSADELKTSAFWLATSIGVAFVIVVGALCLLVRHYALKGVHWLGSKFIQVAPAPIAIIGRRLVGGVRLIYGAALLCGVTSWGLSLVIWHASPDDLGGAVLMNPLFWLTWLGVMAAILTAGIVGAVLFRRGIVLGAIGRARLWKALERKAR